MNEGRTVFAQLLDFLPQYEFDKCVARCLHQCGAFFVTRAKHNFRCTRRYSRPVDKTTGLRFDQTVVTTGFYAQIHFPDPLRRIGYRDPKTGAALVFLTNNFTVPALTIVQLYQGRWQIELFFKWIKRHLRIKAFYGTSANAVRTQIWSAIAVNLLVAILKKRLHLDASLYTILQILSLKLDHPRDQLPSHRDKLGWSNGKVSPDKGKLSPADHFIGVCNLQFARRRGDFPPQKIGIGRLGLEF
jgi:hypothetical protein